VVNTKKFIGLKKSSAIGKAKLLRIIYRIIQEDDKKYSLITDSYKLNRVNFIIQEGKITSCILG